MTVMEHWSATRFMLWEQCPGLFKERYIDGKPLEVTEAMAFGSAVHQGLEEHYRGKDGGLAFRKAWKAYGPDGSHLTATGLNLLDRVYELELDGTPELPFSLDTADELGAPIVGAIDLVGADGVVYDFKTTKGAWSQERAQKEVWQPLLYSWARWEQEPAYTATFEYIVLNRVSGTLSRFRRVWTADEWVAAMSALWDRMRTISADVAAGRFECTGSHGYCPECGARWSHEHICEPQVRRVRVHANTQ